MQSPSLASTNPSAQATGRRAALLPVLLAAGLGAFVLWAVGLAGPEVVHGVAHDARHGHAFPCH